MKAKSVRRYPRPGYPTRPEVISNPYLLRKHVPAQWRALPSMSGSIALFLAANTLVHGADKKTPAAKSAAIVAPIFEHGEGRGSTGCVVVAPPVFLSEEEAWQVIDEELAKRGVKIPEKNVEVQGVRIPGRILTRTSNGAEIEERAKPLLGDGKFSADRANSKQHIAVEFISHRDYSKAGGPYERSTAQSYEFKETAKLLAQDVSKGAKEKLYFGVLYDPLHSTASETLRKEKPQTREDFVNLYRAMIAESTTESKRLLRLQVQDFLKWLEAQGAI